MTTRLHWAGTRALAVVLPAITVAAAFVMAAPAASAAKTNTKFCDAVSNISDQVDSSPNVGDTAGLKSTASALKDAAKSAPKAVKSAMNTMANFYSNLAGKSRAEAAAEAAKGISNYSKAAAKFTNYYVKNCAVLPTTTTKKGS